MPHNASDGYSFPALGTVLQKFIPTEIFILCFLRRKSFVKIYDLQDMYILYVALLAPYAAQFRPCHV